MANPAGDWQDHGCSEGAAAVSAVMQVHRDGAVVSVHELLCTVHGCPNTAGHFISGDTPMP